MELAESTHLEKGDFGPKIQLFCETAVTIFMKFDLFKVANLPSKVILDGIQTFLANIAPWSWLKARILEMVDFGPKIQLFCETAVTIFHEV